MNYPRETDNSAHYPKFSEEHHYPNPYKNVGQRIKVKNPQNKYKEPTKPKKEKDRPKTHHHHHHKIKLIVPAQNIKNPGHKFVAVPVGPPVYVPVAVKTGYIPVYNQPPAAKPAKPVKPVYNPPPPPPQYQYPYPPPQPQYAYPPQPQYAYPPQAQYPYPPPKNKYLVVPPGYGYLEDSGFC